MNYRKKSPSFQRNFGKRLLKTLLDGKGKIIVSESLHNNKFLIYSYRLFCEQSGVWVLTNRFNEVISEFSSFESATTFVICHAHGRFDLSDKIKQYDQKYIFQKNMVEIYQHRHNRVKLEHHMTLKQKYKNHLTQTIDLAKYFKLSGIYHHGFETNQSSKQA